jgi:hypothetical protein
MAEDSAKRGPTRVEVLRIQRMKACRGIGEEAVRVDGRVGRPVNLPDSSEP